jgi:sulfite reductase alpha subunit-like flavoprotein
MAGVHTSAAELPSRGAVTVLYGSQTGTAQDLAERTARLLTRAAFRVRLCSMSSYDVRQLPTEVRWQQVP